MALLYSAVVDVPLSFARHRSGPSCSSGTDWLSYRLCHSRRLSFVVFVGIPFCVRCCRGRIRSDVGRGQFCEFLELNIRETSARKRTRPGCFFLLNNCGKLVKNRSSCSYQSVSEPFIKIMVWCLASVPLSVAVPLFIYLRTCICMTDPRC